jgi:ketosteroid isomerase-like protein
MDQDLATFQKLNDELVGAGLRGDFATVAGMYTEDADLLPPGSAMIKGRSNIQAYWTKVGEHIADVKNTTLEVEPLGNGAVRLIGTLRTVTKGQPPQQIIGKYVNIWRKVGSDWKMALDIWNRDN